MSEQELRTENDVKRLQDLCFSAASDAGRWSVLPEDDPVIVPVVLYIIHTKLHNTIKNNHEGAMDEKLPHRSLLEVALADAVMRILDLAGACKLDLGGAIAEKMTLKAGGRTHEDENTR